MKVFLFDIDGTLLLTGGAGRVAMQHVMRDVYRLDNLAQIEVQGRTDFAIVRDLFQAHDIEHTAHSHTEFCQRYHQYLSETVGECAGYLMPGVTQLLERLHHQVDVQLGLLTGNTQLGAEIKLRHYKLDQYFQFGGFGDWAAERNEVADLAYQECREFLGREIPASNVWIVGDTIHDVRCARSIGANCIAVATGGQSLDSLKREEPDLVLEDLSDHEEVMQIVS